MLMQLRCIRTRESCKAASSTMLPLGFGLVLGSWACFLAVLGAWALGHCAPPRIACLCSPTHRLGLFLSVVRSAEIERKQKESKENKGQINCMNINNYYYLQFFFFLLSKCSKKKKKQSNDRKYIFCENVFAISCSLITNKTRKE